MCVCVCVCVSARLSLCASHYVSCCVAGLNVCLINSGKSNKHKVNLSTVCVLITSTFNVRLSCNVCYRCRVVHLSAGSQTLAHVMLLLLHSVLCVCVNLTWCGCNSIPAKWLVQCSAMLIITGCSCCLSKHGWVEFYRRYIIHVLNFSEILKCDNYGYRFTAQP